MGDETCDKCQSDIDINQDRKIRRVILRTWYDTADAFTSQRAYVVCDECYQDIKAVMLGKAGSK